MQNGSQKAGHGAGYGDSDEDEEPFTPIGGEGQGGADMDPHRDEDELMEEHLDPHRDPHITLPLELESGGGYKARKRRAFAKHTLNALTCVVALSFIITGLHFLRVTIRNSPAESPRCSGVLQDTEFRLVADYSGKDFLDYWEFQTFDDPTKGTVNYLNRFQAQAQNLTFFDAENGQWFLLADTTRVVGQEERGRDAVRMESWERYHQGLVVLDVSHVPTGCGTWPAFWMYDDPWPSVGEIDIIEGVHMSDSNAVTLHTDKNCTMEDVDEHSFQGIWNLGMLNSSADNCNIKAKDQYPNQGCGISAPRGTMGRSMNEDGGGVYVSEWDDSGIRVFFFKRGAIPEDLECGSPKPEQWGAPMARFEFSNTSCPAGLFGHQRIVINLTFCGSWGEPVWEKGDAGKGVMDSMGSQCFEESGGTTCDAFVRENPAAFRDAFWQISYVRVYQRAASDQ